MSTTEDVYVSDSTLRGPAVHRLRVRAVIRETADAITLVFDTSEHAEDFRYKP